MELTRRSQVRNLKNTNIYVVICYQFLTSVSVCFKTDNTFESCGSVIQSLTISVVGFIKKLELSDVQDAP